MLKLNLLDVKSLDICRSVGDYFDNIPDCGVVVSDNLGSTYSMNSSAVASEDSCMHVSAIIRAYKPRRILDFGTGLGKTSYYLSEFSDESSHVTSVEHIAEFSDAAKGHIETLDKRLGRKNYDKTL